MGQRLIFSKGDGLAKFRLGRSPVPVVGKGYPAERDMGDVEFGVELNGPLGCTPTSYGILRIVVPVLGHHRQAFGEPAVGGGEAGIDGGGLAEIINRLVHRFGRPAAPVIFAKLKTFDGMRIGTCWEPRVKPPDGGKSEQRRCNSGDGPSTGAILNQADS